MDKSIVPMTESQKELVLTNANLVYDIWWKYITKEDYVRRWQDDIIQEGFVGLCSAARSYDSSTSTSFSTWASVCIRNAMICFVRDFLRPARTLSSLEQIINLHNNGDYITLEDTIKDKIINPEDQVSQKEILTLLFDLIKIQPQQHQEVLQYSLLGYRIKDIGQVVQWKFTTRQISVIKNRFLTKARIIVKKSLYPSKTLFSNQKDYLAELANVWKAARHVKG